MKTERKMTSVIQEVKFFFKNVPVYDFSFESCDVAHVFRCFVQELIGILKVQVFSGSLLESN